MTIEAIIEHDQPDFEPGNPAPQPQAETGLHAQATAAIMRLLRGNPAVAKEIKGVLRARVHVQELIRSSTRAEEIATEAEQHESNLAVKLDPAGHRVLSCWLGVTVVVALVILDAFPLNWAAQAFGLNPAGTWLVTFILVVASAGAMLGFELTRGHPRRRGVLAAVVSAGYIALLGLRTEFLTTVTGESLATAFLQSALLTAISAGLVWCGSAVLARTRLLSHSRAQAAVRRTARVAEDARAAEVQASDKLRRHLGSFHHMLYPWALSSPAPEGVDHAKWAAALDEAINALFPMPLPALGDQVLPGGAGIGGDCCVELEHERPHADF